jgi:predicted nucleic acid-binding Zn ribbon protein
VSPSCLACGVPLHEGADPQRRTCGKTCRTRLYRRRKARRRDQAVDLVVAATREALASHPEAAEAVEREALSLLRRR